MKDLILKYALKNALDYNGKANFQAVLGKILNEKPELRRNIKDLAKEINEVIKKVNSMKLDDIKKDISKYEFEEKPKVEDAPSNLINSGYYIFSPKIFDYIDQTKDFLMLEKDIFPVLAQAGLLYGFKGDGQWFDTGTMERYEKVIKEWRGV